MMYWILVDRATGWQVEWSDEFGWWWLMFEPGGGVGDLGGVEHPVDWVRVSAAGERHPVEPVPGAPLEPDLDPPRP